MAAIKYKYLFGNKIYVSPFWIYDPKDAINSIYNDRSPLSYIEKNRLWRDIVVSNDILIKEYSLRDLCVKMYSFIDKDSISYRVSFIRGTKECSIYVLIALSKLYLKSVLRTSYSVLDRNLSDKHLLSVESFEEPTLYKEGVIRVLLRDPKYIYDCVEYESKKRIKTNNHYSYNPDTIKGLFSLDNYDNDLDLDLVEFIKNSGFLD